MLKDYEEEFNVEDRNTWRTKTCQPSSWMMMISAWKPAHWTYCVHQWH